MAITKKSLKKKGYRNWNLLDMESLFGAESKNASFRAKNRMLLYGILNDKQTSWN